MMVLLWMLVALAAPPGTTPATSAAPTGASPERVASAARLRAMLGSHATGPALSRAEVLAAIDTRHPKAQAMLLDAERARGEARAARGAFDPAAILDAKGAVAGYYGYGLIDTALAWDSGPMTLSAGWRWAGDAGRNGLPGYHDEYETLAGGEIRVGLALPLLEGLGTDPERTGRRVADLQVDGASAAADATLLALRQKGVQTWAKWVAAGRILALETALVDIARQRQRAVEVRIELGDLAEIERIRNQQILVEREAELALARGAQLAATEDLALYLRDPEGRPLRPGVERLPDRSPAPTRAAQYPEDPLQLALDVHPLLRVARAELAARRADLRLARQAILPDIALVSEISRDLGGGPDPKPSLEPTVAMVGLKGKLPTLNRKDTGKADAAEAKVQKAEADLVWLEDQVRRDVLRALALEEASLEAWRAAARSVEVALVLQDAEQQRFDAGDIDLLRLWQVEQGTAKVVADEIKAWTNYQFAVADLEAAVGTPLLDGV